jgi:hypothetical protein
MGEVWSFGDDLLRLARPGVIRVKRDLTGIRENQEVEI